MISVESRDKNIAQRKSIILSHLMIAPLIVPLSFNVGNRPALFLAREIAMSSLPI